MYSAESQQIGNRGENGFESYARNLGWNPEKASRHDDMHRHIDLYITIGGVRFSVDVKGKKQGLSRGLITVEILNVRGDKGWLFGDADFIVFQMNDGTWMMVDRRKLVERTLRKMGIGSYDELYEMDKSRDKFCLAPKWYQRHGRGDAITNLTIKEVEGL